MFALIHITIAIPVILHLEDANWRYLRSALRVASPVRAVAFREEVEWDPVTVCSWLSLEDRILRGVDLPAWIVSGWRSSAPLPCTLARIAAAFHGGYRYVYSRSGEMAVSWGFVGLIFLQWLIVGSFPVLRVKRWFREPSVVITVCALVGVLALAWQYTDAPQKDIPDLAASIVMLVAWTAWLVWFMWLGLVLIKAAKAKWRRLVVNA